MHVASQMWSQSILDVLSYSHFRFTLPKVVEDPNPHDLEYPDIPSIPEENEEDSSSSSRESPINFEEFSPKKIYCPLKKELVRKQTFDDWAKIINADQKNFTLNK